MIIHKTSNSESGGMEFILSTARADRYDDVIEPSGWDWKNFSKNPIALFNHDKNFPIGRWERLSVKDGALRGHLVMAPKGTSPRHDELRALMDAGILRSVSVGFIPLESEPRARGGTRYIKQELVETSLVAIPANPDALLAAYKTGASKEIIKMIFQRNDNSRIPRRRVTANNNATQSHRNAAIHARAKALLKKIEESDRRERIEKARALAKKTALKQERSGGITWRGQKIPSSWFYPEHRKNWWDKKS